MKWTPRRVAFHILILIVVLVVTSAVAIWLELGPIVHSQTEMTTRISH